ncbi:unnamed protein product [Symbiodinium sp. KB8]|nr:unnamed protein product [Symbiodinium sp. KB8]
MGEGAHRYESCLNPSVCELDFTQLAELKASLMPLRDRSARTDVAETMSRTQAFETCAKHHARYVEIVVQLQQTKSCNFNHSGAFCAPVSCAVPYEKWILSAEYFAHQFPGCAKFAAQPCVWQNSAKLERLAHIRDVPLLFDHLELLPHGIVPHTRPSDPRGASTAALLEALEALEDDDALLPWALLRPFADAAQPPGRPGPLRVFRSTRGLRRLQGLKIILYVAAPPLWTLLCLQEAWDGEDPLPGFVDRLEADCQPQHQEHLELLLASATGPVEMRLPPRPKIVKLCSEPWLAVAAHLEEKMAPQRERLVFALARGGLSVPPEVLLPLRELCPSKIPTGPALDEASAVCRTSLVTRSPAPAPPLQRFEQPTGCSCRAAITPCLTSAALKRCPVSRGRRAVVAAFDLQIPLDKPYRTWGSHDAPIDFLRNFDLRLTSGPLPERVLLLPERRLARYPLSTWTERRLRRAGVRVLEVPWIEPPDLSPSVAERNKQNHFGNREYIRLHAFNLQEYDVIVYLDLDIRITGDLGPAFNCGQQMFLSTGSNFAALDGGFFAVKPSRALFAAMLDVLQTVEYDRKTGWNRLGHGRSVALGTHEGNYPAGPQGFLYHFFYMSDPSVAHALARRGASAMRSAQLDRCRWNYGSQHGEFFWRYVDEESFFQAMPAEWREEAKHFFQDVGEWTFPCDFTLEPPVIVHHTDDAMDSYLSYINTKNATKPR